MNAHHHLAAAARLYGPSPGELRDALIEAAQHQLSLALELITTGPEAEARIDAFLAQNFGIQKTGLRLRAQIGGANG